VGFIHKSASADFLFRPCGAGFLGRSVPPLRWNMLDNMYGRAMAWIWIGCEEIPKFTPPEYMRLSFNRSRPGLSENPQGCKKGKLAQEEMVQAGLAKIEVFKDRGELKYEMRLVGKK